MRRVAMKGLATAVATGGVLAATGYAYADSTAAGIADASPGVLAGNAIQLPVNVPVNACGNTVDVLGLLNPAAGNTCANVSSAHHEGKRDSSHHGGKPGSSHEGGKRGSSHEGNGGGASATGVAADSPGVLSGNGLQLPIDLPVNVSGNSVSVVGVGNPAVGNTSLNESAPHHPAPQHHRVTPPAPPAPVVPAQAPAEAAPAETAISATQGAALAQTGADGLGFAVPASAALVLGGAVLYRRFRSVNQ
ncbi:MULTISPECIES: chaplin [unclassified Streptomyces]|uniref:chaplin n=1 Tax=unclassified Streptomyces TaxID=2593676 RepID=UPI003818F6D1